jgi:hypothetical protein
MTATTITEGTRMRVSQSFQPERATASSYRPPRGTVNEYATSSMVVDPRRFALRSSVSVGPSP